MKKKKRLQRNNAQQKEHSSGKGILSMHLDKASHIIVAAAPDCTSVQVCV